jgi:predicted N-acetyltransferase YhbS
MITYQIEKKLNPEAFREVLIQSGLGVRRPVDDLQRITQMVLNASLILTARDGDTLIGVARSITDFVYCTYLSDLAVDQAYQGKGIGTELVRRTKMETPQAKLILLSAPGAVAYYPRIGMSRHEHCYYLDDVALLK